MLPQPHAQKMISYQERLAACTDQVAKLVADMDELERLRERVKKTELLFCTLRRAEQKRAGGRRKPRDSSSANYYRLR
jgi:hypothetical protein